MANIITSANSPFFISSGVTSDGDTVSSGGTEIVLSGGRVSGTGVDGGGVLVINSGGSGFLAALTGIPGSGANNLATEIVSRGGIVTETSVSSGGALVVSSGGLAVSTTVVSTGVDANSGGLVLSGAKGGGKASATVVSDGGQESVFSGGVDIGAIIASGGFLNIFSGGNPTAYTGVVSGFGGVGHANHTQFIDLLGVAFVSGQITSSYTQVGSGGTLFVSSGGVEVAEIHLIGNYSSGNFHITSGISGSVKITDPAVVNGGTVEIGSAQTFPRNGIDLPNIAFGAQTTLAYSQNAAGTGGTLTVSDGRHAAVIALLGNYIAGSFAAVADGHGGTLVTEASQNTQPLLTHPRA